MRWSRGFVLDFRWRCWFRCRVVVNLETFACVISTIRIKCSIEFISNFVTMDTVINEVVVILVVLERV